MSLPYSIGIISPLTPLIVIQRGSEVAPLSAHDGRVVRGVRQRGILAVVQEAVAPAAVADEEERGQKDQGTDGARLPLQQEAEQVEAHEHGVVEPERRVQRLRDQQHRQQPLEAIHGPGSEEGQWSKKESLLL